LIIGASGWLFNKESITMRGNMNVKFNTFMQVTYIHVLVCF